MRHRGVGLWVALSALLLVLGLAGAAEGQSLTLWHAYREAEQRALQGALDRWQAAHPSVRLNVLAVPFEAYGAKLEAAIPRGNGPDVFIDAHERLASYRSRQLVVPVVEARAEALSAAIDHFDETALRAFTAPEGLFAWPLSVKCVALYLNPRFWPAGRDPASLEAVEALQGTLSRGTYALVYEAGSAYFHAPMLHAFGGAFLSDDGRYTFDGAAAEASVARVRQLLAAGVVPEEAGGALVSQLFASGRASAAISGPWLAAELGDRVAYRVVPLPRVLSTGRVMAPFATVEGAMVSARAREPVLARDLAAYLASPEAAVLRARVGRQVVVTRAAWEQAPELAADPILSTFRRAAALARPMPGHPNMRAAWEPARQALQKALRGDRGVGDALREGHHRFDDVTRPLPARRSPTLYLLGLGVFALGLALRAVQRAREAPFRAALRRSWPAYRWVAHAVLIVTALVIAPLVLGATTSLYATREGTSYFVGLANYVDILRARGGPLLASGSFYRVLLVTLLWTAANLSLHLGLGVVLALVLSRPMMRLRALYRVLLIVPWAVPSYVTALAWKGMFHRQFGAINAALSALGVEPVSWFARFSTAFAANVATNVWLGFPFMMVVTIGALAAIPRDLYEAASVDGATPWQQFWQITVPLLRPSLGPSVAMGAVWTFNQFNVVFLVSGGEPDGETDILVSEAYRWAFTRQAQYGYAAAYAVLIFALLGLVNVWQGRARGDR